MALRPLRIATTSQLDQAVREAGYEAFLVPDDLPDFNRPIEDRIARGQEYERFLEKNDIDLLIDFNTQAMTVVPARDGSPEFSLTTTATGVPYVALFLDPVTSTMGQVPWDLRWHLLENGSWIKGIFDFAHAEELTRLGIPQAVHAPIGIGPFAYDTNPVTKLDAQPLVAFMGHPATAWFGSDNSHLPGQLHAGLLAAGVHGDMPDVPFHSIYFDMYSLGSPPAPADTQAQRAAAAREYYMNKFAYSAFLALKQRDRWVRFLSNKLYDSFELIGDGWGDAYGLRHTPRIWDRAELLRRMRHVPICLNLIKGSCETGLILRHFEITATGGFMLTYPTAELSQFFEIGEECDVFHNEQELLEKIAYYVENPKRRSEIALAGQRRTLSEHTLSKRITKVVDRLRACGMVRGGMPGSPVDAVHDAVGDERAMAPGR